MKPAKMILCVCADECALSRRVFLLETRMYRTMRAQTAAEARLKIAAVLPGTVDLLLVDLPLDDAPGLFRAAKKMQPGLPALLVGGTGWLDLGADVVMPKGANLPAEVLERIRILVTRKRGPKPLFGVKKPAASVVLAAAAEEVSA